MLVIKDLVLTFPLQELRRAYACSVRASFARESQGWPFSILVSVGVPHLVALSAYEQIIEQENHATMGGVDPGRRLEHLQSIITMLEAFEKSSRSPDKTAYEEVSLQWFFA
jgi:hypothetical protein